MRFALLGDHPDGLDMAWALVESKRFEMACYSGPPLGLEWLRRRGLEAPSLADLEEVLAQPGLTFVVVGAGMGVRAAQVRRALQSELHVLCVHPIDSSADVAYEVALLQEETGKVVLPMMAEAFHPALRRLADILGRKIAIPRTERTPASSAPGQEHVQDLGGYRPGVLGPEIAERPPAHPDFGLPGAGGPLILEVERWSHEELIRPGDSAAGRFHLPGWDALRFLGGEIVEIMALSGAEEELLPGRPILFQGRFDGERLFRGLYLPDQAEAQLRYSLLGGRGRADLLFPMGWPGPSRLTWTKADGATRTEDYPAFHPWQALVEAFEEALVRLPRAAPYGAGKSVTNSWTRTGRVGWQDALRALELDDAVRRSLHRRRAASLDLQEVGEEAGFKGTMTLIGCSLLWLSLVLLILSVWIPFLGWLILPVFGVFLVLQLVGWGVKKD